MSRELKVAADVAQLLPAAVLAQLEAVVDDPDNVCCVCEELIAGPSADVAVFAEDKFAHVTLAHPACMTSGVRSAPGLDRCMAQACTGPRESEMATLLGLRDSSPRALLFLEPSLTVCGWDGDPLGTFAVGLGLSPVPARSIGSRHRQPICSAFNAGRTGLPCSTSSAPIPLPRADRNSINGGLQPTARRSSSSPAASA